MTIRRLTSVFLFIGDKSVKETIYECICGSRIKIKKWRAVKQIEQKRNQKYFYDRNINENERRSCRREIHLLRSNGKDTVWEMITIFLHNTPIDYHFYQCNRCNNKKEKTKSTKEKQDGCEGYAVGVTSRSGQCHNDNFAEGPSCCCCWLLLR